MPLKLIPPREGKTENFYIRGTYLGRYVDRSAKTGVKRTAQKILKRTQRDIERGITAGTGARTFAGAAAAYMKAGGERRRLLPILKYFGGSKTLPEIDQDEIDTCASALMPNASAATRNREIYTPISAVLKRAGVDKEIKRPLGWRGKKATRWLEPEQAFRLFAAADKRDREFGLFLRFLFYTGMRLSEALGVRLGYINLKRRFLYIPTSKNDEPRAVYLPPALVSALRAHPRGLSRSALERLFRFHVSGRLRSWFNDAKTAARIVLPARQGGFHIFCHTYGTLMRRYGGLDNYDLVDTGRWKDPASAARYGHTEPGSAARRAALLPVEKKRIRR